MNCRNKRLFINMRRRTLPCLLSLLVVNGCSASAPPDESPSCGQPVHLHSVKVVEAAQHGAQGNIDAIVSYATEQVGPFQLLSTSTFRIDSWPTRSGKPRWVHAQEATASKGCNVMIIVGSDMLRAQSRGGLEGSGSPTLHYYVLMGSSTPE